MKDTEKIITALLTSDTQKEASAKAGISDRMLRSYLANPVFNAEYQRRKQKGKLLHLPPLRRRLRPENLFEII